MLVSIARSPTALAHSRRRNLLLIPAYLSIDGLNPEDKKRIAQVGLNRWWEEACDAEEKRIKEKWLGRKLSTKRSLAERVYADLAHCRAPQELHSVRRNG